jgi:MtN3 and saliva related transmembrane protein
MPDVAISAVGWASAVILLATLIRQVFVQWRDRNSTGVSAWLFVGQLLASTGFVVYSYLIHNWVFVVANACIALVAIAGECIYLRNRRLAHRSIAASSPCIGAAH